MIKVIKLKEGHYIVRDKIVAILDNTTGSEIKLLSGLTVKTSNTPLEILNSLT
jgi:hypothetical protein